MMYGSSDICGFDYLGAADALASQYITLRIKSIDREKLQRAVGGAKGTIAKSALSFVDLGPRAALDAAMPAVRSAAKDYGVDLETTVSNVPPSKGGRALSEFWPGLALGVGFGAMSLAIVKGIGALIGKRG